MLLIPDKIINGGGLLYNGQEWKNFGREIGNKMVKYIPEHPQIMGLQRGSMQCWSRQFLLQWLKVKISGWRYRNTCKTIVISRIQVQVTPLQSLLQEEAQKERFPILGGKPARKQTKQRNRTSPHKRRKEDCVYKTNVKLVKVKPGHIALLSQK